MKLKDLKVVIVGGGSSYTPGIVQALIASRDRFDFSELILYDIDNQRNDDMLLIVEYQIGKEGLEHCITVNATSDPKIAFTQADFIFSQIRVGGLKMREQDEKIPLKHGLVGQETCGLGGFSYGLRTIKEILNIVEYVQIYAPEAWILNYTNPETIVSEAVRRAFPRIKMINACDMTISIEETIARNYGYDRKNWIPVYYGLNHFGWYKSIYDKSLDRDIMPEILERLKNEGLKVASFNEGDTTWQEAWEMMAKIVTNFPDAVPNNYLEYYLYSEETVEKMDLNYTRANMVMDSRERRTKIMAEKIRNHVGGNILDFNFGEHGQYIVDMAVSILNDDHGRYMLIVENKGAIPNLRDDAMVEVPSYVGRTGVEPISLRFEIDDFHKGLMEAQNAAEKLLVDAYFEESYDKALKAFTLNQTVPNANVAKKVLDEFIVANEGYWPKLK
ncbi:family 4 glycosyl hydrolase [Vagococcus acidifermentans]|uniref:Maltose-6'-phosphate glucosidase n=1 Tax=Vagococcus acidifermentans TaxID=564710 RepID=A0A430ALW5_9ENTE|nr:maltose-6'-phosphate glucosidase [Vagococcus acidifermentans]RSU09112.1 maltose-6'-phosphate glucosidase [Vagococcus acidifermentans]